MFSNIYKDKTVLITGHTGFKGSWLATWLTSLGAKVVGYSAYLPSEPCNFNASQLSNILTHIEGDVRDYQKLYSVFELHQPDVVFHLAAQPIVTQSYENPKETFDTNIGGTVNVLECIRLAKNVKAAVMITSDKCYRNQEWAWGYREHDELGGDDPYSASKAGAEIVCRSYFESYYRSGIMQTRIATARAGNVIGGGDWALARIIPDCVRAWTTQNPAIIRNPEATRPWQHVLEPLSGYLWLGAQLISSDSLVGEAYNFGPDQKINKSVGELINLFLKTWGHAEWKYDQTGNNRKENKLLKLSCDKALHDLNWHAVLSFEETVRLTSEWYRAYYEGKISIFELSLAQIRHYCERAQQQSLLWCELGIAA